MDRGRPRPWRRRTAVLAVALAALLLGAGPASAHSELERSDPPHGGMVAEGRTALTLWFGDAINADASSFDLRTAAGVRRAGACPGRPSVAGGVVRLATGPLATDTYELDWRVLSLADGHPSGGSVLFGVGTRPTVVPTRRQRPAGPAGARPAVARPVRGPAGDRRAGRLGPGARVAGRRRTPPPATCPARRRAGIGHRGLLRRPDPPVRTHRSGTSPRTWVGADLDHPRGHSVGAPLDGEGGRARGRGGGGLVVGDAPPPVGGPGAGQPWCRWPWRRGWEPPPAMRRPCPSGSGRAALASRGPRRRGGCLGRRAGASSPCACSH